MGAALRAPLKGRGFVIAASLFRLSGISLLSMLLLGWLKQTTQPVENFARVFNSEHPDRREMCSLW